MCGVSRRCCIYWCLGDWGLMSRHGWWRWWGWSILWWSLSFLSRGCVYVCDATSTMYVYVCAYFDIWLWRIEARRRDLCVAQSVDTRHKPSRHGGRRETHTRSLKHTHAHVYTPTRKMTAHNHTQQKKTTSTCFILWRWRLNSSAKKKQNEEEKTQSTCETQKTNNRNVLNNQIKMI